jgi:MFS family permease
VSTCLGGAFIGSLLSGWIADGVGRRRAFQLSALPMIVGASMRYAYTIKSLISLRLNANWSFVLQSWVLSLLCYILSFI